LFYPPPIVKIMLTVSWHQFVLPTCGY
jgi:hypothetical protein